VPHLRPPAGSSRAAAGRHVPRRATSCPDAELQPRKPGQPGDQEAEEQRASAAADRPNWRRRYRRVLPFTEARRCVQAVGFSNKEEWDDWVSDGKKSPYFGPYVPSDPDVMYAEDWQGWGDWLGTMLSFEAARNVVGGLGLKSQEDWFNFVDEDPWRLSALRVPARPRVYYRQQWQSYDHWLGLPEQTFYVPKEWGKIWGDGVA